MVEEEQVLEDVRISEEQKRFRQREAEGLRVRELIRVYENNIDDRL